MLQNKPVLVQIITNLITLTLNKENKDLIVPEEMETTAEETSKRGKGMKKDQEDEVVVAEDVEPSMELIILEKMSRMMLWNQVTMHTKAVPDTITMKLATLLIGVEELEEEVVVETHTGKKQDLLKKLNSTATKRWLMLLNNKWNSFRNGSSIAERTSKS